MRVLILKNSPQEGPGLLEDYLLEAGDRVSVVEPADLGAPASPGDYDALVVLGGPMNVDETRKHPHLAHVDASLAQALKAEKPILGICLGAQQLVKAAGGRVIQNPTKEIGMYEVQLTGAGRRDPLYLGTSDRTPTFQWHGDQMVPTPSMQVLALSDDCPVQAVRVAANAYGLQYHLEVTPQMVKDWCMHGTEELAEEGLEAGRIESGFQERFHELRLLAWRLFANFFEEIVGTP